MTISTRFKVLRQLRSNGDTRLGVWLVSNLSDGTQCVLKRTHQHALVGQDVLAHLRSLPDSSNLLLLPFEQGMSGGAGYELYPFPGDEVVPLSDPVGVELWPQIGREIVASLAKTLALLHTPYNGKWVLHADIKPSNIFLSRYGPGNWQIRLGDFDAATLSEDALIGIVPSRYTPRNAAPEIFGRALISQSADYWSLGMSIAELVMGKHPLDGMTVDAQRRYLVTDWTPTLSQVDSIEWRALLGGLLHRDPDLRWSLNNINAWLANDRRSIAAGLHLAGESASSVPFHVAGSLVYDERGLAQAILRHWELIK